MIVVRLALKSLANRWLTAVLTVAAIAARDTATKLPMLAGTVDSNEVQIKALLKRVVSEQRPKVGIIGLAFKEGTDEVDDTWTNW